MKLNLKLLAPFLTLLSVVSCGSQMYWYKPYAGQNEFATADYECLKGAQQMEGRSSYTNIGGLVDSSSSSSATTRVGAVTNPALYNSCMQAKGWRLQRQEAAASYDTPSTSLSYCRGNDPVVWNNCIGTYTYPNGNKYTGEYRNGQRDGKGTMYIVAKGVSNKDYIGSNVPSTYVGEFRNGRLNGHGVWTTQNGDRFEGTFVDNILVKQDSK